MRTAFWGITAIGAGKLHWIGAGADPDVLPLFVWVVALIFCIIQDVKEICE